MIKKLFFLKKMIFRKMLNWTRRLDFRKHRPKVFLQGVENFFSQSPEIIGKSFQKKPQKILFYT